MKDKIRESAKKYFEEELSGEPLYQDLVIDWLTEFAYKQVKLFAIPVVSVSLLRSKAKEYAKFKHQNEYNDPIYHRDVLETLNDFEAGYKAALKDCNER
jgi:hypothetical protein